MLRHVESLWQHQHARRHRSDGGIHLHHDQLDASHPSEALSLLDHCSSRRPLVLFQRSSNRTKLATHMSCLTCQSVAACLRSTWQVESAQAQRADIWC